MIPRYLRKPVWVKFVHCVLVIAFIAPLIVPRRWITAKPLAPASEVFLPPVESESNITFNPRINHSEFWGNDSLVSPRQQNQLNIDPLSQLPDFVWQEQLQEVTLDPLFTLHPLVKEGYLDLENETEVAEISVFSVSSTTHPTNLFDTSSLTLPTPVVQPPTFIPNTVPHPLSPQGGIVTSPDKKVVINFSENALDAIATGYYIPIQPTNVPPSLAATTVAFELSVNSQETNAPISFFPPEVKTYTVEYPEYQVSQVMYVVTPTVSIEVRYDEAEASGMLENHLHLYRQDPLTLAWQLMPGRVDSENNVVMATVELDGRYTLFFSLPQTNATFFTGTAVEDEPPLVLLDPDHGGSDPGGEVIYPPIFAAEEKNYNLEVAQIVRSQLEACGLNVQMTREGDYSVSSEARADMINGASPDAAVTLAFDILYKEMNYLASGTAAWIDLSNPNQSEFGNHIANRVHEYADLNNRGLKDGAWIYVVSHINPDIIYSHNELAFMDNYDDRAIMDDAAGMAAIATGVAVAIVDELGGEEICDPGFEFPPPLSAEERARLRKLGYANWMRYRGDPANTSTGDHIQQFTDFWVPGLGGFDFVIQRTYSSLDSRDGLFGMGWSSWLDMYLRLANDGSIDVRYPDGSGVYFISENGGFVPGQDGVFDTLAYNGPDLILKTPDQMSYHFVIMGAIGVLVKVEDRFGNQITLTRDENGRISTITDSAGRVYPVGYDSNHISNISDPAGRTWHYSYDSNGNLERATNPNGGSYHFGYQGHWLTTLTDPAGILYLQNFYDNQGRIIEQIDASGTHSTFIYQDGQTTFNDNLGQPIVDSYDDLGRVTQTTDVLGYTEYFTYDADYNVVSYTDKRGHTWTYTYDDRGNRLTETDPLGFVTSYSYNTNNDVTGVTDQGGPGNTSRTTHYLYDSAGNLVQVTYPDGNTVHAAYDGHGQLVAMADENGHTTSYTYDGAGNLILVTDPMGHQTHYTYDAVGRQISITDANGRIAQFIYDDNDNIVQIVDPKGQSTYFTYDSNDNLTQTVDRRGGITTYQYDENLKLIAETDPMGYVTHYNYDAMYNRTQMIDPRGNITLYRYDALSRLVELENAVGAITQFVYDPNGNVTQVIGALGRRTTNYTYDAVNRLETQTNALGWVTTWTYDAVGRTSSMINPRDAVTQYVYDLRDRVIYTVDALGNVWANVYDPTGNVVSQTNANGNTTTLEYDAVNRLITQTDAGGNSTRLIYDGVGNVISLQDALGRLTTYSYDANDNLFTMTDALGGVTSYGYDAEDAITAVTDANNNTTYFTYDLNGMLLTLTEAGGQLTHYTYDPARNLVAVVDARENEWQYTYNPLNLRDSETDPLGNITQYTYDITGRLAMLTDANGIASRYDYDVLDQLKAVTQNFQRDLPANHETNVTTWYGYDSVGNLTHIHDANGEATVFRYDLLDRVVQETNPLGNRWQYQYDAVGNLILRRDANGADTIYQYDANELVTAVYYPDSTGLTYTYDPVYNQTSVSNELGTIINEYDSLNRLMTSTNHLEQQVSYTYDAVGNRTSITYPDGSTVQYQYDSTNYLRRVIDPDRNGFLITRSATHQILRIKYPNNMVSNFRYDQADRLRQVTNELQENGRIHTLANFDYTLDAIGNRTQAEVTYGREFSGTLTTDYTYDPLYRLVRSEDSEGTFTTYSFDAVGNRLEMVTNHDPLLLYSHDMVTTTYSYDGANELITAVRDVQTDQPLSREQQVAYVTQLVISFIFEVEAQAGLHIEETTANLLRLDANNLWRLLDDDTLPTVEAVAEQLTALTEEVSLAGQQGTIDSQSVLDSLLGKLSRATQANSGENGRLLSEYYRYDDNGNRTLQLAVDETNYHQWWRTHYHYDFENRLERQMVYTGFDPRDTRWRQMNHTGLAYDGYGRVFMRRHHWLNGEDWTKYVYDGLDPIAEYTSRTEHTNYYRGAGRILEQESKTGLYYYHHDGLGSVIAITQADATPVQDYRYTDYGTILGWDGHPAEPADFATPHNFYTYTGQEWDRRTDTYHFFARDYDPQTGTWLQQDPYRGEINAPSTLHRNNYVSNNPINFVDWGGFTKVTKGSYFVEVNDDTGDIFAGGWITTLGLGVQTPNSSASISSVGSKYFGGFNYGMCLLNPWQEPLQGFRLNPLEKVSVTFYSDLVSPVTISLTRPPEDVCTNCSADSIADNKSTNSKQTATSNNGYVRYEFLLAVPHIDQLTYSGKYSGAGEYICAAASLTMALQYYLGAKVTLNQVADGLIDDGYIKGKLQDSRALEWFINAHQTTYNVTAKHYSQGFNVDWIIDRLTYGGPIIVAVPGHYTIVTGYREMSDGSYQFYVNDPYRGHWGSGSNSVLNNEWLTQSQLQGIWGKGAPGSQVTVLYP